MTKFPRECARVASVTTKIESPMSYISKNLHGNAKIALIAVHSKNNKNWLKSVLEKS